MNKLRNHANIDNLDELSKPIMCNTVYLDDSAINRAKHEPKVKRGSSALDELEGSDTDGS